MYTIAIIIVSTAALLQIAVAAGERHAVFNGHRQQWRQTVLPRRQWGKTQSDRAGSHIGEHVIALRQRHFMTSTMSPILGHWRSLHDKLQTQSMWPGINRFANEASLPATTQNETARDIAERKNLTDILEILNDPSYKKRSNNSKTKKKTKDNKIPTDITIKKQWSPYGCHYFPDTNEFPKPKLNSLPEEPLYAGEQYYLDLAGNIRKGPVGVGYTCYCAPFFKELEARLDHNTKKLKQQICRTEDNINRRLCSVEKQLKRSNEKLQQVTQEMSDNDSELENRFRTKCSIDTTVMDPNLRWRLDYLTARRHDDIPCNDSGYSTKMFSNSQGPSPSLSNLMENGISVPIIDSKTPKSVNLLPDNNHMESIV